MSRLFIDTPMDQEFNGRWTRLERELRALNEAALSDPETVVSAISKETDAEVPWLAREKATFPIRTEGTETEVRVVIPFVGHGGYFHMQPMNAGRIPSLEAVWSGDREPRKTLELSETFPAGTSAETVRAWAKEQVDMIETCLDALRSEVEQRSGELRMRAEEFAEQRLRSLRNERSLAEGLGEGI